MDSPPLVTASQTYGHQLPAVLFGCCIREGPLAYLEQGLPVWFFPSFIPFDFT
jgi:hypothetical protein